MTVRHHYIYQAGTKRHFNNEKTL